MNSEDILEILERTGAVKTGHFQLSSGLHAAKYFQCALALEDAETTAGIGRAIADLYDRDEIDTVISPAIGGIVLGYAVALALGKRFIWAERVATVMTLRRGFCLTEGERVLVVEDVITTGGSVGEVIALAMKAGAEIQGVACLIDRGGHPDVVGFELKALMTEVTEAYAPEKCPLCSAGKPIESPGSRRS
jgi:orotate phosphoribosyltransferase